MKKRILSLLLAVILTFALTACSSLNDTPEVNTGNYEVYLAPVTFETYSRTILREDAPSFESNKTPEELTKTVQINGSLYWLEYVRTRITADVHYVHIYHTKDRNAECYYWADTMRLHTVSFRNLDMRPSDEMDLSAHEQWIRQFVSQFSTKPWDDYQVSYYTLKGTTSAKEFITEFTEDSPLISRQIHYDKYLGEIPTTDRMCFSFGSVNNPVVGVDVILSRHDFDSFPDSAVDPEAVKAAVLDYVKSNLRPEVTLLHCNPSIKWLTCYDGNYLVCCRVVVEYRLENVDNELAQELSIVVDIPDP